MASLTGSKRGKGKSTEAFEFLITTNFQLRGASTIRVSGWRIEHGKESHSISKRSLNT